MTLTDFRNPFIILVPACTDDCVVRAVNSINLILPASTLLNQPTFGC